MCSDNKQTQSCLSNLCLQQPTERRRIYERAKPTDLQQECIVLFKQSTEEQTTERIIILFLEGFGSRQVILRDSLKAVIHVVSFAFNLA